MVALPRTLPGFKLVRCDLSVQRSTSAARSGNRLAGVVEYADPVWLADLTFRPLRASDLRAAEAWFTSLRDGLRPVLFQSPHYCHPRAHTRARGPETQAGTLGTVTNGNTATVSGLAAGLILSPGDYVSFVQNDLHALGQIVEASGSGTSRRIEVEPVLPRAFWGGGATVRFDRAELLMRTVPGSWSVDGEPAMPRSASFQLIESRL